MTLFLTELAKHLLQAEELTEAMTILLRKIEQNCEYIPMFTSEFSRLEKAFEKEYVVEMGASL